MFPTTRRPRQMLMIFARVPELGRVKSRIAAELGEADTLVLYRAMLADLLESVGTSDETTEVEVLWTGSDSISGREVEASFDGRPLARQVGATLGDRLNLAFSERIVFHAAEKVIAIGADDPALGRRLIDCAFNLLESCEWVVGPASDGGYYLIGCRAESFRAEIFLGIDWGTSSVFAQTMERLHQAELTVATLPERSDIDYPADLHSYLEREQPPRLRALLDQWRWNR